MADSIAVCAIFKNEAPYILEWIAYHRLVGIDHFVLYDNASTDGGAELVARSTLARFVTLIDWPMAAGQLPAYADFIANHGPNFTWAAFIDMDEFIHPLETDTIPPLLPRYERFSGVLLCWLTFGPSGHRTRPFGPVLQNYVQRMPTEAGINSHVKSMLRTAHIKDVHTTPHIFQVDGPSCNARGERVPAHALQDYPCHDVMVINHYFTKSTAEWRGKIARGKADHLSPAHNPYPEGAFLAMEAEAVVEDRRITRFLPQLRHALKDALPVPAAPNIVSAAVAPRPLQLGIGIITYNRRDILAATLDHIVRHTKHPTTAVLVADDGSTDGTLEMLRARHVPTVTGRNMGIAWNKNRALFALTELLRCDIVILLEDDTFPNRNNWEAEWMNAALRWGHANVAGEWLRSSFLSGAGTAEDPILGTRTTAQCSVFSREAVLFGGYFDPRFRGFGHEHVEHSRRMVRMGYGGYDTRVNGQTITRYRLLSGGIGYHPVPTTHYNAEEADRNYQIARLAMGDFTYRAPWQDEAEAVQFRDEMRAAFPRPLL